MTTNLSIGKTVITKALAGKPVKGMVYFLHGPCDDGTGLQTWINKTVGGSFAFKNCPVVYPSSPIQSYGLHGGNKETIWFDQLALNPNFPEDYGTISAVAEKLKELIQDGEARTGVSQENVIIGGFSMGGTMALHLGYKFNSSLAGVFALSSFLPPDSQLYDSMDRELTIPKNSPDNTNLKDGETNSNSAYEAALKNVQLPKLFMSHGLQDPIIPLRWGKSTFYDLRKRGVSGHFYTMENVPHSMSKQQLGLLHNWIDNTLYNKDKSNSVGTERNNR